MTCFPPEEAARMKAEKAGEILPLPNWVSLQETTLQGDDERMLDTAESIREHEKLVPASRAATRGGRL